MNECDQSKWEKEGWLSGLGISKSQIYLRDREERRIIEREKKERE